MAKVLVLFAHPRVDRSTVNAALLESARAVDGVTVIDLYATYPDFDIDIDAEQGRLARHDVLILQHPLYWYSAPALVKEWLDLVLEYGFAYGSGGTALAGKTVFNAITCGAPGSAYCESGLNGHPLDALLLPFEQTFALCGMRYLTPFVLFGAGEACSQTAMGEHIRSWQAVLEALAADRIDHAAAINAKTLAAGSST